MIVVWIAVFVLYFSPSDPGEYSPQRVFSRPIYSYQACMQEYRKLPKDYNFIGCHAVPLDKFNNFKGKWRNQ